MPARRLLISNRHPRLRFDRKAVAGVIATLDAHAAKFRGGCPSGELSLVFLTDAALARLHADFLGDPTVTDVITFSAPPASIEANTENEVAGEICVSADAAMRQSKHPKGRRGKPDYSGELTLYLVHGWLHLAGYDDLQPQKKRAMRGAEARALKLLRSKAKMPRFIIRS
jgi:probable rRNA maturation factor